MVDFIKPSLLGTEKEFDNLYGDPIKNGQHKDSTDIEIKIMKQRSFVLHKKLSKLVQVQLSNSNSSYYQALCIFKLLNMSYMFYL